MFSSGEIRKSIEMPTNKVKVLIDTWEFVPGLVDVSIDSSSESRKFSQQVDRVLVGIGPVIGLLDTLFVCGSEGTVVVQSGDSHPKLSHGVQSLRKAVENLAFPDFGNG
jgi:hypothetical protein